jgi:hypothetical protein
MTLMFLSRGYFASWNCQREVRHAMMVHQGGQAGFTHTALTQAVTDRRRDLGAHMSSSVVLVRETDEAMHGGQPIEELLQACPGQIGCADHVFSFDGGCEDCAGFSVDVRAALAHHAAGAGPGLGVIEWRRVQAFKLVSLKQIVTSMLLARAGGKHQAELREHVKSAAKLSTRTTEPALPTAQALADQSAVCVHGEIDSLKYAIPTRTAPRVLLHSGCHLTEELPGLLKAAVSGVDVLVIEGDSSDGDGHVASAESDIAMILRDTADGASAAAQPATATRPVVLIVVIHRDCFKDVRIVRSLLLALQTKTQIVLVHESDAKSHGCDFGEVIANCPPAVKAVRGHNDQKIFDPIAVQWTRGAHQPVSVRVLAQALGAKAGACAGQGRVRGWSTFGAVGGGPEKAGARRSVPGSGSANPMVMVNPMVGGQGLAFRGQAKAVGKTGGVPEPPRNQLV